MQITNNTSGEPCEAKNDLAELSALLHQQVCGIEADDLPRLAQLHDAISKFCGMAEAALDAQSAEVIAASAKPGMRVLEQIVLGETDDFRTAIDQVMKSIDEVQALIAHGPSLQLACPAAKTPEPLPASVPPTTQAPAPVACDSGARARQVPLNESDMSLVHEFLGEATEHIESAEAGLLQLEENGSNPDAINAIFRGFHSIKGVAGFLNLVQISSLAHAAENVLDLARKGKLNFDSAVADVILQSIDAMRKLIDLLRRLPPTGGAPAEMAGLEGLLAQLHDCAEGRKTSAPQAAAAPASTPTATLKDTAPAPAAEQRTQQTVTDSTIKVSTDRLDFLINMVGELVIAEAMVEQDMSRSAAQDRRISRNLSHLGKITRELQDLSMSMRMVPIQGVFQKMARLVRDLAHKGGKEINLELTGGETELDRNVVEAVSDPLVHMVRNAADHGIEPPEERVKAGKPREGKLQLKAYHQSGNIVIEITDDGRGLNKSRLVRKGIEAGLVQPGQDLSDQEIFQLVFAPGLSTAEKVTDVSGRGVGMDVVRRNVQALRGQIDIASTEGKGSTFTIRLPLTLAVIDGLVVKVGSERYIIPITSIEQSIQPRPEQISTVHNRAEMCMVRNELVPVLRLHRFFGVTPAHEDATQGLLVIVQSLTSRCCLLVDELLGQQQVVIKSLGQSFGQVDGISGGAILGDGNISLILDVPGLISAATKA